MDLTDKIIAYESGEMVKQEELVAFFQELIDSGMVWKLQGHYGRTAKALIQGNLCQMPNQKTSEEVLAEQG